MKWNSDRIGDQAGRLAVVTGANSGIGYEAALALARKGADVVMACRNPDRAEAAAAVVRKGGARGAVICRALDLSRLASVAAFSERLLAEHRRLDILIANAGVMMPRRRTETADGFELQFGTNHLGHFALAGRLLPRLVATAGSRVVVVSSLAHRRGRVDFEDLDWTRRPYDRMASYGQSKLANLLFAGELARRLERAAAPTLAVAAHPGWTVTNLQREVPLFRVLNPLVGMRPWQGALPTLYAATAEDVGSGDYVGPDGLAETRGFPARARRSAAARDEASAARLWQVSETLTGVRYLG